MSTRKASSAKVQIANAGESVKWLEGHTYPEQATYALCRFGQSAKKPY